MRNHAYWTEYLQSARNGHDRPINGSSSKRVLHGPNGDIILRLHYTDVVTLHADGTETIHTGGWNTVSTKAFIAEHSKARVWSDKGQLFVGCAAPTLTPPRVTKCRTCHGARKMPYDCWRCHGVGRCDYGSNPVHYRWDGEPLRIDSDGSPIGPPVSAAGYHKPSSHNYADSGTLLRSVLPALSIFTQCPHCEVKVSLERVVIHLNDSVKWSRERVADWLDTLDLDLSFPVPDHIPAHIS